MLTHLQIRDFAIIDAVELELHPGLTVLTGETGAGKSILVDALQLAAGGRAGAEVVRHGRERAEVAATFDLGRAGGGLDAWLAAQSIDAEGELTVRRVVGADGRSRAYLNGQAVPVQLLREAGALLLDIHGQHEFQSLTRATAQRELLDDYGSLTGDVAGVGAAHHAWLELLNRTLELESRTRDRDSRLELLRYQVQELAALQPLEGEAAALGEERLRLANRGRLAGGLSAALGELYENEGASAHGALSRALQALRGLAGLDPRLAAQLPALEEATIQVREIARELEHCGAALDIDATRQDEVERRLAAMEELARKHRVPPAELPAHAGRLRAELAACERADSDLGTLRAELGAALETYRERARALSARRAATARALAREVTARMQTLGMSGGRFEAEVSPDGGAEPAPHGLDHVEFRVSANPGTPPRALAKVASGGELSRLSLAVQVACAESGGRCMIFDEVDAGIGGAVAEIVGRELRALGARGQVLCVTHLPQVASQGHHHLRVAKLTDGRATRTAVAVLGVEERVEELARMLGGVEVTTRARDHARDMLAAAGESAGTPAAGSADGGTVRLKRPPAGRRR